MRIYVHNKSSYVGRAILAAARGQGIETLEDLDTEAAERTSGNEESRAGTPQFFDFDKSKRPSRGYDALVFELTGSPNSAAEALEALSRQKGAKKDRIFIAISSALTWGRTQLQPPTAPAPSAAQHATSAVPSAESITAAVDQAAAALSEQPNANTQAASRADASAPPPLTSLSAADADKRMATVLARHVLEVERSILAASTRQCKTFVVCPGILYGDGETAQGLHSLFRTAWDGQPDSPVPIFGKGSNRLPMMHIADFAAYVTAVCASPPAQQYLLAVDDSRLAQRDVVTAVAAHLGKCPVREQALHEFMFQQGIEHMLVNLPLVCTPLTPAPALLYKEGLVAHLDAVVQQYIDKRHLQPLRLFLAGPPAAGKSAIASRLGKYYQLQVVSARTILAAADELGGPAKQELQADLNSKTGRASDAIMLKLCKHVLSKREAHMKGFILEGWPKTLDQAEQLFTEDQPYTPEERARLEALRDTQAGIVPQAAGKAKPAKPDPKGKTKADLPKRRAPLADLFPSHVFSLEAAESVLQARSVAVGEQETAAAGKAAPAAAKGKPAAPGGVSGSHNNEKDFKRRYAAYKASHEGDEAGLKAAQAAAQLLWDDKRIQLEEAAAAEAEIANAAAAKMMRMNTLASMKSVVAGGTMRGGTLGGGTQGTLGGSRSSTRSSIMMGNTSSSRTIKTPPTERPEGTGMTFPDKLLRLLLLPCVHLCLTALPSHPQLPASTPSSWPPAADKAERTGTTPPAPKLPAAAALEAHISKGPPKMTHSGLLCLFQQYGAKLEVLDADEWPEGEAPTVEVLTDTITDQVGTPHNYSATDPGPTPDQDPPEVAPEAGEADDSAEAAGSAADRTDAFQPSADEVEEEAHLEDMRSKMIAMRAEPMRRYLMQQLMPVVAKAIVDVQTDQTDDPVKFVAQQLLVAGEKIDLQYIDPYAAEIYGVQRAKWDAKRARAAHKQALLDAKQRRATNEDEFA